MPEKIIQQFRLFFPVFKIFRASAFMNQLIGCAQQPVRFGSQFNVRTEMLFYQKIQDLIQPSVIIFSRPRSAALMYILFKDVPEANVPDS